jgi:hypothetical protein
MSTDHWDRVVFSLKQAGIAFDAGLSDTEISETESRFKFRFPPDLRAFLQVGLPVGERFPNWRSGKESALQDWLDLPREGILFDVENNNFWLPEWGPRPESFESAKGVVKDVVDAAPKLIPIYAHRMMPDEPQSLGNPIFSVHQTDIIYYGFDLDDYFRNEFGFRLRLPWPATVRPIRFWDIERFCDVRWEDGPCVFNNRAAPSN